MYWIQFSKGNKSVNNSSVVCCLVTLFLLFTHMKMHMIGHHGDIFTSKLSHRLVAEKLVSSHVSSSMKLYAGTVMILTTYKHQHANMLPMAMLSITYSMFTVLVSLLPC